MDFKILEIRAFTSPEDTTNYETKRIIKDYEIDIELGNGRVYMYDGSPVQKLCRGDILIRKPGGVVWAKGRQKSYVLTLDFAGHIPAQQYHRLLPGPSQPVCQNALVKDLPFLLRTENSDVFIMIYRKLLALSDFNSPAAKTLVMELLFRLNAELCSQKYETIKPQETICDIVLSYMRKNLHKSITLTELADLVHLEKSYFTRQFHSAIGKTPIEALIEMRLEHATELVGNTNTKICDIAELCGYKTTSFFISEYKKKYGMTPEAHRKSLLTQNQL